MSAPVESKVTAGALTAAAVTMCMWALSFVPFVEDMPVAVAGALLVLVTGAVTFAAAWLAPHTPRPPDAPSLGLATNAELDAEREARDMMGHTDPAYRTVDE